MTEPRRVIDYNRLSVISGALVLALALIRFLETPARQVVQTEVLGSPLGIGLSASNLMPLIILGLTTTGMASMLQGHPVRRRREIKHWYMYWIMPGMLNMALARWLSRADSSSGWVIALTACAIMVPTALFAEYRAVDMDGRAFQLSQWRHTMFVYLTTVAFFTLIYDARSRSLLSATTISLVTLLLAGRLFWGHTTSLARAFLYGAVAAVILGQMTWGLNYWALSGLQGGLFLLLAFYVVVGLLLRFLDGRLDDSRESRRILLEYLAVAVVALPFVLFLAP